MVFTLKRFQVTSFTMLFMFHFLASPLFADNSVEISDYCELSIKILQQQIDNFEELTTLAYQYDIGSDEFKEIEAEKQAGFEEQTTSLLNSYGFTASEYVLYMGKNKNDVEAYWNENPELKVQLDSLSILAGQLLQEFEGRKAPITEETSEPPLPLIE